MPTIKPLDKLVTKARDLRDHHGLLHTIDDHEEPPERNPFK
jgi:hypothetical protein